MSFDIGVKANLTPPSASGYGAPMDKPAPPKKEPLDPVRRGIGLRLKTAREQKGLTQQEVATKFDVNKATVSAWETGAGAPDAVRLRRLARLYDVSADALLWDDSLTTEAMRFAAQFDALNDRQQRSFRAMWLAYFEEAVSDESVEKSMPITMGRREDDPPYALPRPIRSDSPAADQQERQHGDRRRAHK